ncbi:type VI secretion system amidase effector protein Tae4 [Sulfurimonas sp.]|uniref:type VI secretion system amidase effector protein Tae4 n=1 Tax=Sulfurimonas sp. TaxID=2022749 RepID=UPI003D13027A
MAGMAEVQVNGQTINTIKINRPKYSDLEPYFMKVVKLKACEVFKLIHKELAARCKGERESEGCHQVDYSNACATRMSYTFNKSNFKLKLPKDFQDEKTGEPYVLSVNKMTQVLEKAFGNSDITFDGNPNNFKSEINGKKGILIFKVSGWGDANGHITLWDGTICPNGNLDYNHCYFEHHQNGVKTTDIIFWELK